MALLLFVGWTGLAPAAPAAAVPPTDDPGLTEVGQVAVPTAPGVSVSDRQHSGWLLVNPTTRRGYQVLETFTHTVIVSFNLDTLETRRRVTIAGMPVNSGIGETSAPGSTSWSGEIVHAFDEEKGRLYLAMSDQGLDKSPGSLLGAGAPDGQRPLSRIVMIDEAAFDKGLSAWGNSFREPSSQVYLHSFWLLGLEVSRHRGTDGYGKLLALFAMPEFGLFQTGTPLRGHHLVQWDPGSLRRTAGPDASDASAELLLPTGASSRILDPCAPWSVAHNQHALSGNLQWGILATKTGVFTGCHGTNGVALAAEVELDGNGDLAAGSAIRAYPLGKKVADVLVDEGGERLLFKAVDNDNITLWVFDAEERRFAGSLAATLALGSHTEFGIDGTTGRLYALVPGHNTQSAGRTIPVRGGLQVADTRLDPVPPLENILPEMASSGYWRIRVDPATRRIFVRRGHSPNGELYYRVFEDRIPVRGQAPEGDDSLFTTDTAEAEGVTSASYLGSATGYGVRSLLIGGLDAATGGTTRFYDDSSLGTDEPGDGDPSSARCGRDDREIMTSSVPDVTVSDQSVTAEAASLDADIRTQRQLGTPEECLQRGAPHTEQTAFDEKGPDGPDPGTEPDRTGVNHYGARCVGDETKSPKGFQERKIGRTAYTASARCDRDEDSAEGKAAGTTSVRDEVGSLGIPAPGGDTNDLVRVASSSSTVTVSRETGGGVTTKVDSVAKGIEIAGVGTIAVVRVEATSTATGRRGGAEATFSRTICGVVIEDELNQPGCLSEGQQGALVEALNERLGSRGRANLRKPDPKRLAGSASGYGAGVQRRHEEEFEDKVITKDNSVAVPGLELIFYQGDGSSSWGTGRQVVQLAGAQASTSYGITCLYGQAATGRCNTDSTPFFDDISDATSLDAYAAPTYYDDTPFTADASSSTNPGLLTKIIRAIGGFTARVGKGLLLALSSPTQGALVAAVWALLYLPHYLGARRRLLPSTQL